MIPVELAGVAVGIAKGVIKLGGRLDRLLAEKVSVQGNLVLAQPTLGGGPDTPDMVADLRDLLDRTAGQQPDPLGTRRKALSQLVAHPTNPQQVEEFYTLFFPDKAVEPDINPNALFVQSLQRAFPSVRFEDEETRRAAFYVAAGLDDRQIGYPGRLGLLVADALLEFGAEQTGLFLRDETARRAVTAVLARLAEPDLDSFTQWQPLVRHALRATLNGLLDAREAWAGQAEWLDVLLGVLVEARASAGDQADEFLLGLFEGRGYQRLVSQGLARAAAVLGQPDRQAFSQIAADVLKAAGTIVAGEKAGFLEFFSDHWGDLLHAGLVSIEKHSPALLKNQQPLIRDVLVAMVQELAALQGRDYFTGETLFHLADAAISAVALNPEGLKPAVRQEWLRDLIVSLADTLRSPSIRRIFTKAGLESLVSSALAVLARHPDLLVKKEGLFQEVVGGILEAVSDASPFDAAAVADAAVQGALETIAANPALLDVPYAQAIADVAGALAGLVADRSLTQLQAAEVARIAAAAALRNPVLFGDAKKNLAAAVLEVIAKLAGKDRLGLLAGAALSTLFARLLEVYARHGLAQIQAQPWKEIPAQLAQVLTAGFALAQKELGLRLDATAVPEILAQLTDLWLRGRLSTLDPDEVAFKDLFRQLLEAAA